VFEESGEIIDSDSMASPRPYIIPYLAKVTPVCFYHTLKQSKADYLMLSKVWVKCCRNNWITLKLSWRHFW